MICWKQKAFLRLGAVGFSMKTGQSIRLKKILSRSNRSAIWGVHNIEGLLLGKAHSDPLGRRISGWTWLVLDDQLSDGLKVLRGQVFRTRRDAVNGLKLALEFSLL